MVKFLSLKMKQQKKKKGFEKKKNRLCQPRILLSENEDQG
jgi:hypothetical protein